jgi:hypothetical protein
MLMPPGQETDGAACHKLRMDIQWNAEMLIGRGFAASGALGAHLASPLKG